MPVIPSFVKNSHIDRNNSQPKLPKSFVNQETKKIHSHVKPREGGILEKIVHHRSKFL